MQARGQHRSSAEGGSITPQDYAPLRAPGKRRLAVSVRRPLPARPPHASRRLGKVSGRARSEAGMSVGLADLGSRQRQIA